ncbi:hypothetical protein B0H16DRAFT_967172 [Mycena metata]|uniref:Uncharacterized protein n=1 Tax=Mycena metata TaxID=1033252 RepID=A0AAD7ILR5_9AGAR|nr:hypothetical protein B0H16DRAFT_967172 [Mycena metata]
MPRKRPLTIFLVFFCVFVAPDVLKLFPHTDALVDTSTWVQDLMTQGLASSTLFIAVAMACSLVRDAYRWLTGTPTTPTPAQLEDGTVATKPSHELAVLEVGVVCAEPPAASDTSTAETDSTQTQTTTRSKIIGLVFGSLFFANEVARHGIVSRELPWWENLGVVLLFILRGFGVIFCLALLMFGVWVTRRVTPATAAAPVEVLFERTLPEEQQEKEMVSTTEKA